jgi:hypothetical protein
MLVRQALQVEFEEASNSRRWKPFRHLKSLPWFMELPVEIMLEVCSLSFAHLFALEYFLEIDLSVPPSRHSIPSFIHE